MRMRRRGSLLLLLQLFVLVLVLVALCSVVCVRSIELDGSVEYGVIVSGSSGEEDGDGGSVDVGVEEEEEKEETKEETDGSQDDDDSSGVGWAERYERDFALHHNEMSSSGNAEFLLSQNNPSEEADHHEEAEEKHHDEAPATPDDEEEEEPPPTRPKSLNDVAFKRSLPRRHHKSRVDEAYRPDAPDTPVAPAGAGAARAQRQAGDEDGEGLASENAAAVLTDLKAMDSDPYNQLRNRVPLVLPTGGTLPVPSPLWYFIFIIGGLLLVPCAQQVQSWCRRRGPSLPLIGRLVTRLVAKKKEKTGHVLNLDDVAALPFESSVPDAAAKKPVAPVAIEMESVVPRPRRTATMIRHASPNALLSTRLIERIVPHLPTRLRSLSWVTLFNSVDDGMHLGTLYRKLHKKGPTVLVVQDSQRCLFGAFVAHSWNATSRLYFGNGETFVLSLSPHFAVYKWSNRNAFFALGKEDCLAVGGGNNFAIWLDGRLRAGTSMPCETFNSPCLASSPDYQIYGVEVWGFVSND